MLETLLRIIIKYQLFCSVNKDFYLGFAQTDDVAHMERFYDLMGENKKNTEFHSMEFCILWNPKILQDSVHAKF